MSSTVNQEALRPEVKLIQALILGTQEILGTIAYTKDVRRIGLNTERSLDEIGSMAHLVDVNGTVQGWIALDLNRKLAAYLTGKMLDEPSDSLSDEDIQDSIKELANMISGSAKRYLAEKTDLRVKLSIPTSMAAEKIPDLLEKSSAPISVCFEAEGQPFWVIVNYAKRS